MPIAEDGAVPVERHTPKKMESAGYGHLSEEQILEGVSEVNYAN
jgi:hypothetical protein